MLKIFSIALVLSTMIAFNGCGCTPEVRYVDRPVEVKVPVKCKMPEVYCDFNGTGSEPAIKAFECIITQKRAMEVCR